MILWRWSGLDSFDALALVAMATHVYLAPYSKVEESFNTQALYDLHAHPLDLAHFDHKQFPGVVPRTFLGALALVVAAFPLRVVEGVFHPTSIETSLLHVQSIYRFLLGAMSVAALLRLRVAAAGRFGKRTGSLLLLLFATTQFHLPFYCSRTLPNPFSLIACTLAFAAWLQSRPYQSLSILTAAAVIFRCDVLILLFPMALQMLIASEVTFIGGIFCGASTGLLSLLATVLVDSYFWGQWVWPEGVVFFFNTALDKSSEWGVSPLHWYLTSALPRSFHFLMLFIAAAFIGVKYPSCTEWAMWRRTLLRRSSGAGELGSALVFSSLVRLFFRRKRVVIVYYSAPAVIYIALYSLLAHKELRFILPVYPVLLLAAAVGLNGLLPELASEMEDRKEEPSQPHNSSFAAVLDRIRLIMGVIVRCCCLLFMLLSVFMTALSTVVSHYNYPGGYALARFNNIIAQRDCHVGCPPVTVHMDVLACMTGVTRFGELVNVSDVHYNKTEGPISLDDFDWLIHATPRDADNFDVIERISGLAGVVYSTRWPFITIQLEDKLLILRKKSGSH